MKTTAFTKYHIAAGAKMAEFAGYNMPIEFTGINDEHMTVRNGAGVFDVSHMGEIWVKGPEGRGAAAAHHHQRRRKALRRQGAVFLHAERPGRHRR